MAQQALEGQSWLSSLNLVDPEALQGQPGPRHCRAAAKDAEELPVLSGHRWAQWRPVAVNKRNNQLKALEATVDGRGAGPEDSNTRGA